MLQGDTITLEYKMSAGEVQKYRTRVESEQTVHEEDAPSQSMKSLLEMTMQQTARSVSDGLFDVDVTIVEGQVHQNDQVTPLPDVGSVIGITMDRTGEIKKTSVNFPFSQPAFPKERLKVGGSWTGDSHLDIPLTDAEGNPSGKKSVTLKYQYTLTGFEKMAGYEVAVIQVKCPATAVELQPEVTQTITAEGKTYFAHKEGRLVRSNVETLTRITAPGAEIKTHIKVAVDLVDAAPPSGGSGSLAGGDEQFIIGA